jgi:hypothetical protein
MSVKAMVITSRLSVSCWCGPLGDDGVVAVVGFVVECTHVDEDDGVIAANFSFSEGFFYPQVPKEFPVDPEGLLAVMVAFYWVEDPLMEETM